MPGLIITAVIIVILLIAGVKIVPQATEYVIERLGKYNKTWGAGIHFLIPISSKTA